MYIDVEIIKNIPEKQIKHFEDRVVYFTAISTREYTKGMRAYPYLSGDLSREEIASPVLGSNGEYGLLAGTSKKVLSYAKYVYNFKKANWTNKSTLPQWYHSVYRAKEKSIMNEAINKALKEIK